MITFLHFLKGYVIINAKGLNIEKFLTGNINLGIYMGNIIRNSYTSVTFSVSLIKFSRLRKNAEKFNIELCSVKYFGMLSFLLRARTRIWFFCGIALIFAVLVAMQAFVLNINITGNETIDYYSVSAYLSELGINIGTAKGDIDFSEIKNALRLRYPEIAYVDANVAGVVFNLEIVEGISPPHIPDTSRPADIIALKDAYITRVIAKKGNAVVFPGQTVIAGQKLIEGSVGELGKPKRYYHAQGEVYGSIWYSGQSEIDLAKEIYTETGNKQQRTLLFLLNNSAEIVKLEKTYEKYKVKDVYEKTYFENLFIPLKIFKQDIYELNLLKPKDKQQDELNIKSATRQAFLNAYAIVPGDVAIADITFSIDIEDNKLFAACLIETNEQIGTLRYITNIAKEETEDK